MEERSEDYEGSIYMYDRCIHNESRKELEIRLGIKWSSLGVVIEFKKTNE